MNPGVAPKSRTTPLILTPRDEQMLTSLYQFRYMSENRQMGCLRTQSTTADGYLASRLDYTERAAGSTQVAPHPDGGSPAAYAAQESDACRVGHI
jgi:hypothetical protein